MGNWKNVVVPIGNVIYGNWEAIKESCLGVCSVRASLAEEVRHYEDATMYHKRPTRRERERNEKIGRVKRLLVVDRTHSQAAEQCGYKHIESMYVACKRVTRHTPT